MAALEYLKAEGNGLIALLHGALCDNGCRYGNPVACLNNNTCNIVEKYDKGELGIVKDNGGVKIINLKS